MSTGRHAISASVQATTWFVAWLRDHDTHLGGNVTDGTVTTLCGYSFRPLATLNGSPPDPLQICPNCVESRSGTGRSEARASWYRGGPNPIADLLASERPR